MSAANVTTASFRGIAGQMFQLENGVRPRIASDVVLRARLNAAAAEVGLKGFSERFLLSEWTNVVDAWGLSVFSEIERTVDRTEGNTSRPVPICKYNSRRSTTACVDKGVR